MPKVLTVEPGSVVNCGHEPGKVKTESSAKLAVNGSRVLLESSIDGKSVVDCGIEPASDPGGCVAVTCTKVSTIPATVPEPPQPADSPSAITAGRAAKLTVGGSPVILETLKGMTNGMQARVSPQTLLSATASQNKLTAI